MNRLLGAGQSLRGLLGGERIRAEAIWPALLSLMANAPSSLGIFCRDAGGALGHRLSGVSPEHVFPLPWIPRSPAAQREMFGTYVVRAEWAHATLLVAVLNYMHGGLQFEICRLAPAAAQKRVMRQQMALARRTAQELKDAEVSSRAIRDFMRLDLFGYGARQVARPLGLRAGVPEVAATCDTAKVLAVHNPPLSALCEDPSLLMKAPEDFPVPRRPFCFTDSSYPQLVARAVEAGLQEYGPETDAVFAAGHHRHGGAFAVEKDEHEDRWISPLEFSNDAVRTEDLPPLIAPYMPQLGTTTLRRGKKLLVSKRDARHYFHVLKRGKRWRRWMAMPPVKDRYGQRHWVYHRSWPMGFKPSAAIAQAVTEAAAADAGLPASLQFRPGVPCPTDFPLWGIIMDDAFALFEARGDDDDLDACEDLRPESWMPSLEQAWAAMDVQSHPKKRIDEEFNAEILGYRVSPEGLIGLSPGKMLPLIVSCIRCGLWWRPPRTPFERTLGKVGHAHMLRPCLRSCFSDVYRIVVEGRRDNVSQLTNTLDSVLEWLCTAVLLPASCMDLSLEWSTRVVATDAAPGGHGEAYTFADETTVRSWASLASHRGDYTTLLADRGLDVPVEGASFMSKASLPIDDFWWYEVPKPGGFSHIALEEYAAHNWSLERRIQRANETSKRVVHLGDNTTQVGAHAKGRSSSRALNCQCRRDMSLQIGGNIVCFELWVASGDNPSDRASRVYAGRRDGRAARVESISEFVPTDRGLTLLPKEIIVHCFVFIHLFSGPRRDGDIECWVRQLCAEVGVMCCVVSFDPLSHSACNILDNIQFSMLRKAAYSGGVHGAHGGPVCATWSKLRYLGAGPPPLRSRERPFGLPHLSPSNQAKTIQGTEFFLRHIDVCNGVELNHGTHSTEHPIDPKGRFPSIWASPQWRARIQQGNSQVDLDQCMYGAETKKATTIGGNLPGLPRLRQKCCHRVHAGKSRGFAKGKFLSAKTSRYPSELCRLLASLHVNAYVKRVSAVTDICDPPPPYFGASGILPTGKPRVPLPPAVPDVWPECEVGCFLDWFASLQQP